MKNKSRFDQRKSLSEDDRTFMRRHGLVRSQDHLSMYSNNKTGRRLTLSEALAAFGEETLVEVVEYGSAVLPIDPFEPARTLYQRRTSLGLRRENLARQLGLEALQIRDAEDPRTRTPIRVLERLAIGLGLDDQKLSTVSGAGGDERLAVRLKTLGQDKSRSFSPALVGTFSEAAWVIQAHARLNSLLGRPRERQLGFEKNDHYGDSLTPAWKVGYELANKTRELLGLPLEDPIESLRDLCETLRIDILQTELPEKIAGATIATGESRGIVVNTKGFNTNVWVRRATIAHELGHLLWDPEPKLKSLRVDTYKQLSRFDAKDFVEARANAFAINLLAPSRATAREFRASTDIGTGVRSVMEKFGISATAAKYHIWNATDRTYDLDELTTESSSPGAEWQGRESLTDDYFPVRDTPRLRRGEFAAAVVAAELRSLISEETAAIYLGTSDAEYQAKRAEILEIFPLYA